MLYKAPGPEPIHGSFLATTIVDADEEGAIDAALAEGWFLTTPEAVEAYEAEKAAIAAEQAAHQFSGIESAPAAAAKGKKAATAPAAPNVGTDAANPATAAWGGVSAPAAQ
jgi:hypothetical protein